MNNHKMKKLWVGITVVLAMAMMTVMVQAQASQAPAWWDNPGGVYTTWTQSITIGDASTDPGNTQTIIISNDIETCQAGDTRDIWVQISWDNTGNNDVTMETGLAQRIIEWTTQPCPATINDPFPGEDLGFLTNVGPYTHDVRENGYEL